MRRITLRTAHHGSWRIVIANGRCVNGDWRWKRQCRHYVRHLAEPAASIESGRGQLHSKTLSRFRERRYFRQLLERGCPLPLYLLTRCPNSVGRGDRTLRRYFSGVCPSTDAFSKRNGSPLPTSTFTFLRRISFELRTVSPAGAAM
jgi:hypothetical protein